MIWFIIWFLLSLLSSHFGGIWWYAITGGVLLTWLTVGFKVDPFDLDKTGSLLNSLLTPLSSPSSSFFWLAMHSSSLTDKSAVDTQDTLSKEKLDNWRSRWRTTFTIPTLKHNLRNSPEVASVKGLVGGITFFSSEALPTAPASRPLPTLPPTPVCLPIYLPLYSTSQLEEAVTSSMLMLQAL